MQSGGPSGSFNGQGSLGARVNEFYVDGIPMTQINMQGNSSIISSSISVDALDQFQVITSGASAQYSGLGVSNFNIKSGTNTFHGSVADFIRNTAFDSWLLRQGRHRAGRRRRYPARAQTGRAPERVFRYARRPHPQEKLFSFIDYDLYHQSLGVNLGLFSIPTLLERQGNLPSWRTPSTTPPATAAARPRTTAHPAPTDSTRCSTASIPQTSSRRGSFRRSRSRCCNSCPIPATRARRTLPERPAFRHQPLGDDRQAGLPVHAEATAFSVVDLRHQQSSRHWLRPARAVLQWPRVHGQQRVAHLHAHVCLLRQPGQEPEVRLTRSGGANLDPWQGQPQYLSCSRARPPTPLPMSPFPASPTPGPTGPPLPTIVTRSTSTLYAIMENLQYTHGSQSITAGFLFQWLDQNDGTLTPTNPLPLTYNSVSTACYTNGTVQNTKTGNSAANFMLGAVYSSSVGVQPFQQLGARFKSFSPNMENDRRVNLRLNLNLGLRWDILTPYHEVLNRWSYEDFNGTNPATGSPGAIVFVGNGPNSCECSTPVPIYLGNLGPRLGLAYSVSPKTVVRAAFSTVYTHTGGVGGASWANYGTGQTGLTGTASFPSSGPSGPIPAFYLNNALPAPYGNNNFPLLPPPATSPEPDRAG